jgi:hypothetical protein
MKKKKLPTLIVRIPIHSLKILKQAAYKHNETTLAACLLGENKYTREIDRAVKTAEKAICIAKLKRGIFT